MGQTSGNVTMVGANLKHSIFVAKDHIRQFMNVQTTLNFYGRTEEAVKF